MSAKGHAFFDGVIVELTDAQGSVVLFNIFLTGLAKVAAQLAIAMQPRQRRG